MNYRSVILMLLTLLVIEPVGAEKKCTELLVKASNAYEQGMYEQVISILEPEVDVCSFQKVEREQALKLLAAAYVKLDEQNKADTYVYSLLKKNPNYAVQTTVDPLPFVNTLKNFKRSSRASIGFSIGQYMPNIDTNNGYSLWADVEVDTKYSVSSSFSFCLMGQYNLNNKWSVFLEPQFTKIKYNKDVVVSDIVDITYNEKSNLIRVPILLGYKFYQKNAFGAMIKAGFYKSFQLNYITQLNYELPEQGIFETGRNHEMARNSKNTGFQTALNLSYTKNKLAFLAQMSFAKDLNTYNSAEDRYKNQNLLQDYNFVDDDIYMSHFDFKLGVSYTFSYRIKQKYRGK